MSQPSKTSGYMDEMKGAVKENVGWAFGNKSMEAEGKVQRAYGAAEVDSACAMERTKGAAQQVEGKVKDVAGAITGDTSMQMKGKAEKLEGKARYDANC